MKCDLCSTPIPDDAAFCPECGNKVGAAAPAPEPTTADPLDKRTRVIPKPGSGNAVLAPGSLFADRYRIESQIGAGGMGTVYLVKDGDKERPIALKVINRTMLDDEGAADRLVAEGLLTRDIRHPNIIAVYDVAKADAQPYVTMEYLEGTSLRAWISRHMGKVEIAVETVVGIVNAILDGLQAAHNEGVVHRDLKPENVMLLGEPNDGDFRLKILDFGIAKAVSASLLASSITAAGTPLYMAPEQRTSPDAAGPAADLYSLSRMFYEMLMGGLPDGMWQPPSEDRSDVPAGVDAVIQKGLKIGALKRQQSVEEYRAEIADAFAGSAPEKQEETPQEDPPKKVHVNNPLDKDPVERKPKKPVPPPRKRPTSSSSGMKTGLLVAGGVAAVLALAFLFGDFDPDEPSWPTQSETNSASAPLSESTGLTAAERLQERMERRAEQQAEQFEADIYGIRSNEEPRIVGKYAQDTMVQDISGTWWSDVNNNSWDPEYRFEIVQRSNGTLAGTVNYKQGGSATLSGAFDGATITLEARSLSLTGIQTDLNHFSVSGQTPDTSFFSTLILHKDRH